MITIITDAKEWRTITLSTGEDIEVAVDGEVQYTNKKGEQVNTYGSDSHHGYKTVCVNGKQYFIHRLVAKAYLDDTLPLKRKDNPADKREIDHRFGRGNNHLSAITICQNHQMNCDSPLSKEAYKNHNGKITKYYDRIDVIDPETDEIITSFADSKWTDIYEWLMQNGKIANSLASAKTNIKHAIRDNRDNPKKKYKAYGYVWRAVDKELTPEQRAWKKYCHEYYLRHPHTEEYWRKLNGK